MNETHPPVAIATDAVITIGFHSLAPRILLGRRAHEPFMDKLVFPGGHFDPGVWSEMHKQYIGNDRIPFDPSLRITTSRETGEEVRVFVYPHQWTFLTELDAPTRDPRPDMRRISLAYWTDLARIPDTLLAGDDLAGYVIADLMELAEGMLGFDHWRAIEILQERWREYFLIWTKHEELGWVHACDQMQGMLSEPEEALLLHILHGDDKPRFVLRRGDEQFELAGMALTCPYCSADLSLPPPE